MAKAAKSSAEKAMTVNDLPASIVTSERVMFYEPISGGARLVTDGVVSAARASALSQTLGWKIELMNIADASPDAQDAFPTVVHLSGAVRKGVETVIQPSKAPGPSSSRKKPRGPKPE